MIVEKFFKLKNNNKSVDLAIQRLDNHLKNYEGQNIREIKNQDYLIHDRYMIHNEFFFTFKSVNMNQQIRLLCYLDDKNDEIVLISFFIKKQRKVKYYNMFKKEAEKYYYNNILHK